MCFGSTGNRKAVHGYWVGYDDDSYKGIYYLKTDLDRDEAKVFFEYARREDEAQFEDDKDRDYTLVHTKGKSYQLIRRD